ncbi:MAG: cytochrome c [Actinobacteria bacterium]|nr:cytochrome c [Actinomycetota bacterium]
MTLAITLRTLVFTVNIIAVLVIAGVLAYRVLSVRRAPKEVEPQNLTPFYDDETLENEHLTRVLRWTLLFSSIVAIVLPLYWVLEPGRQSAEAEGFEERAIERGATLYANDQMPEYDAAKSLLCATCHGTDSAGGSAPFVITPEAQGDTEARPVQVSWAAPALDTVFYRFNDCTAEELAEEAANCARAEQQVTQIITYGRPGTPMPAWGIAGGGPKNAQAVSDLVAYLKSIQVSPAQAKAQVGKDVVALQDQAASALKTARQNLAAAREDLAAAESVTARAAAEIKVARAEEAIVRSRAFKTEVDRASQGKLLFMTQCARCHTNGWSYNDPTNALVPLPGPMGGGAFGPSLTGGSVLEQFPGEPADDPKTPGYQKQYAWVGEGVENNKGYGVRGISSGRMPHFGQIFTQDQIDAVVTYERNL